MIRLYKNLDLSLSLRSSICPSRIAFFASPSQNLALPVYTHPMHTSEKALVVVWKHCPLRVSPCPWEQRDYLILFYTLSTYSVFSKSLMNEGTNTQLLHTSHIYGSFERKRWKNQGWGGGVLKPRGNRIEKGKEKKARTIERDRR